MLKNRFKRILVALDGSANSIRGMNEAISLARQSEGTITGIYVLHGGLSELKNTFTHYNDYLLEKARKFMSNAKTSAARHGIDFEEKIVTSTDTIKTITNFAKSGKFDIIVIGARGAGSPKSEFFGSVSNGILHGSRIPILVVK
jgi:nucleotide-binding universal stress UspA family protein